MLVFSKVPENSNKKTIFKRFIKTESELERELEIRNKIGQMELARLIDKERYAQDICEKSGLSLEQLDYAYRLFKLDTWYGLKKILFNKPTDEGFKTAFSINLRLYEWDFWKNLTKSCLDFKEFGFDINILDYYLIFKDKQIGIEIKSSKDSLKRLESQIQTMKAVCDEVWVFYDQKFKDKIKLEDEIGQVVIYEDRFEILNYPRKLDTKNHAYFLDRVSMKVLKNDFKDRIKQLYKKTGRHELNQTILNNIKDFNWDLYFYEKMKERILRNDYKTGSKEQSRLENKILELVKSNKE